MMVVSFQRYLFFTLVVPLGMPLDIVLTGLMHLTNLTDGLATLFNVPLPNPLLSRETLNSPMIMSRNDEKTYTILPIMFFENSRDVYRTFISSPLNNVLPKQPRSERNVGQDFTVNHEFYSHSMRFLNENIVHLCTVLGIPDRLIWPNCAAVLNLFRIYEYCLHNLQAFADTSVSYVELGDSMEFKDYQEFISNQISDRYILSEEMESVRSEYRLKSESIINQKVTSEALDDWDFINF